jgi:hypothetical protein
MFPDGTKTQIKITITEFATRHFEVGKVGTCIGDFIPNGFVNRVNQEISGDTLYSLVDGYADFCKHIFMPNFTDALSGVVEISHYNINLLQSGYKARREDELPVLARWFSSKHIKREKATFLDLILYSKEQCSKEGEDIGDADYGIVSINGVMNVHEDPMLPTTMIRNALGIEYGGSGVPLDEEAYMRSVEFWDKHAIIIDE